MNRLATICARGGSKGVKGKNLRQLAGKPLIAYTIEQAKESGLFSAVAVSSDSAAILKAGRDWGADYAIERPVELASDAAAKISAIRHCTEAVEAKTEAAFDIIVDLDATTPLRALGDIKGAIRLLEESGAANVVSGAPSRKNPYFNIVEQDERGRVHFSKTLNAPVVRRQDSPACFDLNGAVYAWRREALFSDAPMSVADDTVIYVMAEERAIDIDSELDFLIIEHLMAKAGGNP
ncbi:MAG: acylneuraminate cytidylyltransferase family protein [Rhodospirillales bacterium]|nr:acylneuraminate cytidylyltransferase family protein [Rhodospirillales bacterium]